jgi:hypothetical protein
MIVVGRIKRVIFYPDGNTYLYTLHQPQDSRLKETVKNLFEYRAIK